MSNLASMPVGFGYVDATVVHPSANHLQELCSPNVALQHKSNGTMTDDVSGRDEVISVYSKNLFNITKDFNPVHLGIKAKLDGSIKISIEILEQKHVEQKGWVGYSIHDKTTLVQSTHKKITNIRTSCIKTELAKGGPPVPSPGHNLVSKAFEFVSSYFQGDSAKMKACFHEDVILTDFEHQKMVPHGFVPLSKTGADKVIEFLLAYIQEHPASQLSIKRGDKPQDIHCTLCMVSQEQIMPNEEVFLLSFKEGKISTIGIVRQ